MDKVKEELKHCNDHKANIPVPYEPNRELGQQMGKIFDMLADCDYPLQKEFLLRTIAVLDKSFDDRFQRVEKDIHRAELKMKELHEMKADYHAVINGNELRVNKSY